MNEPDIPNAEPKKREIFRFEGPVELSTGSSPGGFASFFIPLNEPTNAVIETGGSGEVTFGRPPAASPKDGAIGNILRDMREKLAYSLTIIDRIQAATNRDTVNHEFGVFICESKRVVGFFVGTNNRAVFKKGGVDSMGVLDGWVESLNSDDRELVDYVKDERDTVEHERILRPNRRIAIELTEVVHIDDGSTKQITVKAPDSPKITEQSYSVSVNGKPREVISLCVKYLELLEQFLVAAGRSVKE